MAHRSILSATALHRIFCCLCLCAFLPYSGTALAQASSAPAATAAKPASSPNRKRSRKHHSKARRLAKNTAPRKPIATPSPVPVQPPTPAWPIPPAQQPAEPATVILNGDQLTIVAKNSSLHAILDAVSQQTGLKVTGLSGDMRIYGSYGPGTVSQTLHALLQGSPYNYVLVGGDAKHPPKELDFSLAP
jgi:hypothetical protein